MELKGIYELHDRLEAAAVAGVKLAGEDFRLKRAIEGIAPLAEASPVIQKLFRMAMDTVSPDCKDRAGSLLDTLALSQALLCTQAGFGTEEETEDMEIFPRPYVPCRPYSIVHSLEAALTQPGSGRYSVVAAAVKQNPRDLEDYRLQGAMVTALSDRSAEVAQEAERYLSSGSGDILPLVKAGFGQTSEGGKVRRLRVIEHIAGAADNDFYIRLLEHSKKELREEAIFSLRFEKGNGKLLLELSDTEKGGCLNAVRRSLVYMDAEIAEPYFLEQFEKEPKEIAGYLRMSRSDAVSDCLAAQLQLSLDQYEKSGGGMQGNDWGGKALFEQLFQAMPGKASEAMAQVYRRAAASDSMAAVVYHRFPGMLVQSLLWCGDERLLTLARELAAAAGRWWITPAFAADLLTDSAENVYDRYKDKIPKAGFSGLEEKLPKVGWLGQEEKREIRKDMMSVLGRINYNEEKGKQELVTLIEEYGSRGRTCRSGIVLKEPLDSRWYELLMNSRYPADEKAEAVDGQDRRAEMTYDQILFQLLPEERRGEAGAYFYLQARKAADNRGLYQLLIRCGWTHFTGLVPLYVKKNLTVSHSLWEINRLLEQLPLTEEEKKMEIREIDRILCGCPKNSAARRNWDGYNGQRELINEAAGLPGGK